MLVTTTGPDRLVDRVLLSPALVRVLRTAGILWISPGARS
jgi:hypothetical protein